MIYDDTHATADQLAALNCSSYEMAVMTDETGRAPRYLFSSVRPWHPSTLSQPWRRLVVHVQDIDAPGLTEQLCSTMGVEFEDVPF